METIMTPDFTRVIAEIRTITGINDFEAEAIEELLKAELNEYRLELEDYYIEEYHNAMNRARNSAYDNGFTAGYDAGYDVGRFEGYNAGYDDGYAV